MERLIDAVATALCVLGLGLALLGVLAILFPPKTTVPEKIRECNRKGAIYSDGVCQHVFAPICRRL